MKHAHLIVAVAASLVAVSTAAHAGGTLVAAELQFLPSGEIHGDVGPFEGTSDTETAFAVAAIADYVVTPNISVGLAPRFLFNIKGEDGDDSGTQIDLPVRLTGRFPVGRKAAVFAYLAPGYSIIFPPDWPEQLDNPAGFVLGGGGGGAFQISRNLAVVGEIGYTKGYQGGTETNSTPLGDITVEWELDTSFFHLGVGIQTAL